MGSQRSKRRGWAHVGEAPGKEQREVRTVGAKAMGTTHTFGM